MPIDFGLNTHPRTFDHQIVGPDRRTARWMIEARRGVKSFLTAWVGWRA
ncbi:hypothetical protein NDR87_02205 [Nocardia sp. CDC159]|uniref:Uncharacterized protein n=1 Tax=Nocardia pulmonis TaxID=2951408 RepID=A0A9X2E231_9NOCA|nr:MULTISPECIES: hypothetical protein [Nocardia]MCM6772176.1 hypothetical protein [Nocardia pulmonis]MCM6785166.1 hypothetical protein [Nocardia sp. CDC159]